MNEHQTTNRPICTWIPVADESGRLHMEAHWTPAPAAVRSAA